MSELQSTAATNGAAAAPEKGTHVSKFAKKQAQKGAGGKKHHNKKDDHADEPYVVIIKNAENDFSRIHTEALPIFLHLNPAKALGAAPGESVAPYKQNSNYVIKVRTETRSAEVCFYGEENSSLFKSLAPKNPPAASSSNGLGGAKSDGVKKVVKLTDDDDDDDTPAAMGALSTVQDMVEVIRPRPYYQQPLAYTLETTKSVTTDSSSKGGKRARAEDEEPVAAEEEEYATVLGSLKLVEMSLGSKQDKLVSTQMQLNTDLPIKEVRRILKDVPGLVSVWFLHKGTITGGSGGRGRHVTDPSAAPKADDDGEDNEGKGDENADEETADKQAMMMMGGAGSAVYRAVFNDEEALFSAKELLEQFEVSSGVRAMIKLSDGYQRKYDERNREEVQPEEY